MPAVASVAGLPSRLGKYELLMPLAAGGMARIYIGRSTGIGSFERHVVLKMITPERANDQVAVNMFLDEARLAASPQLTPRLHSDYHLPSARAAAHCRGHCG